MQKLTANDPETKSADLTSGNLAKLKALFPELISEGAAGVSVNIDVLKALVGAKAVKDEEEKYGLNWHGKRRARQLALTPGTGTLRPCLEDSVDWDTTKNLMIEGDNLEVLKLLQKSYAGKVKLIYIDPPYNTGKDFVYPDNFQDNIKNYLELTGQTGEDGRKLASNTETSGRFHTDWLNMMYPRLKLARNLLRNDGLIIIHMDENEHANTEKILTEIFGEENLFGIAVWDKKNPKGDATALAYQHESLFIATRDQAEFSKLGGLMRRKKNAETILAKAGQLFAKLGTRALPGDLRRCASRYKLSEESLSPFLRQLDLGVINEEFGEWIKTQNFSGGETAYAKIDEAGDVYRLVSMAWPNKKTAPADYFIPLVHPATGKPCPVPERGWRNPPGTMKRLLDAGEIIFGTDHTSQPQRKYLLKNNLTENLPSIIGYGGSDDALLSQFGLPFEHPKPVELATELILAAIANGDIVMDFFAGSGTTGHAVMACASLHRISGRYILVQFPEPLDPGGKNRQAAAKFCGQIGKPHTLAELTKERLRRAGHKIKKENPAFSGDLGFRVFKLASSNIRTWESDPGNLGENLEASIEHLKTGRTGQDILFELLLKLGLDLCVPIETKMIAGHEVHSIGAGTLLACLALDIPSQDVEPLALGIADWHKTQKSAGETTVVFRDSAFSDDVAKTNLTAILQQHGLETVRSL